MAEVREVTVPDIGDFADVPVIEILVAAGDSVAPEDPLVTLESDKATMDVPAPFAGVVHELRVAVGDKVSEGTPLVALAVEGNGAGPAPAAEPRDAPAPAAARTEAAAPSAIDTATQAEESAARPADQDAAGATSAAPGTAPAGDSPGPASAAPGAAPAVDIPAPASAAPGAAPAGDSAGAAPPYASPSVRRRARELGVDLAGVDGTGRKGRITLEDLERPAPAPEPAAAPAAAPMAGLLPWPQVDFEKFGPVERIALTRIQRLSGPNLARNWVMIPHVTHNDEADITELEAFRKATNAANKDVKVTMVALLVKACVASLQAFPQLNSSLDGEELVLKRYWNIGFAADTPQGLVVPVIKEADRKGILDVARELAALSGAAREGKLKIGDMQGATFTISSLGGIGGTSFTPIINAPEVAILGVTRSAMKPVWDGSDFRPRLMVPLSLSYDHRVIDGALAARFTAHLASVLSDLRRALL
jgi:pyruvate dehydrogenase E2 component (dihydrolipoamide acetyltransferase)